MEARSKEQVDLEDAEEKEEEEEEDSEIGVESLIERLRERFERSQEKIARLR